MDRPLNELPEEPGPVEPADLFRKIVGAYERSPVLRMLVAINPSLGIAESAILGTYAYFQHRRMEVFTDELTTLGLNITEDDVRRKKFFDTFTSTVRHAAAESRDKKIRLFARLFANHLKTKDSTSIDLYEEHLSVLDDLSEREFELLLLLRKYETEHPHQGNENRLKRAQKFWDAFAEEAERSLHIPADQLESSLDRLTRTGLYQTIVGGYWDYTGGRGYLTPRFDSFVKALGLSQTP